MTRIFKKFFLYIIISISTLFSVNTEVISDKDFGFSLDIPEGFNLIDYTEDGLSLLLTHPNNQVNFAIKLYVQTPDSSADKILDSSLTKLNAQKETTTFLWNNTNCAISSFTMKLDKDYTGWALCSPTDSKYYNDSYIVLITYVSADIFDICNQFMLSTLNSLCVDMENYNMPGPVVSFAYPSEGKQNITLNIDGLNINSTLDKCDVEASTFLVDMEYSVLLLYAQHDLWKEAWQRYYRMIYRDGAGRLSKVSEDIYTKLWPVARQKNRNSPSLYYAQSLLTWVQNFGYVNAKTAAESDFTSLPASICGAANDCDSRSMLISALLNSIGIETIMLISPEFHHSMVATSIEAPGQVYEMKEINRYFLLGETTAKVTWGMVFQDFADMEKWFPVILP